VRFGVRHAVDQESMSLAFETVAAGTEAANATVELITVPAVVTCRGCAFSGETTDLLAVCPRCASADVKLSGGDEMTLESVTYVPAAVAREGTGLCAWESPLSLSRVMPVTLTWPKGKWAG